MRLQAILAVCVLATAASAQVKFNEFSVGAGTDFLEIRNNGGGTASVTGWSIETFTQSSLTAGLVADVTFVFPARNIGGRNRLVIEEFGTAGQPGSVANSIATGENFFWNPGRNVVAILRDDAGVAVDYFYSDPLGVGGTPRLPANLSWSGGLRDNASFFQRTQANDTNRAEDWDVAGSPSLGLENSGQFGNRTSHESIMITEVTWGNPDGIEITNFSNTTIDLTGYVALWGSPTAPLVSNPIGVMLAPGQTLVMQELNASRSFPEVPSTVTYLTTAWATSIPTTSGAFSVALQDPDGVIIDEVRIESTTGTPPSAFGRRFTGSVARGVISSVVSGGIERLWGYDTDRASDWTEQRQTSMGLINRSSGPRGSGASAQTPNVQITEVDDNPDFVEVRNLSGGPVNLSGWWIAESSSRLTNASVLYNVARFPSDLPDIQNGEFIILGETTTAPSEMPAGTPYVDVNGSFGFAGNGLTIGLYNERGDLISLVASSDNDAVNVHNNPRLPGPLDAFAGAALTSTGEARIAKTGNLDNGASWRSSVTRSMGLANTVANGAGGQAGLGGTTDVRFSENGSGSGSLTLIIDSDNVNAANYQLLLSFTNSGGRGQFLGLGIDAFSVLSTTLGVPPFAGPLDPEGSFRIDFSSAAVSPGITLDLVVAITGTTGQILDVTPVFQYRSN